MRWEKSFLVFILGFHFLGSLQMNHHISKIINCFVSVTYRIVSIPFSFECLPKFPQMNNLIDYNVQSFIFHWVASADSKLKFGSAKWLSPQHFELKRKNCRRQSAV